MSPNVSAMMQTIKNFVRLATLGEKLEFRVAVISHMAALRLDLPGGSNDDDKAIRPSVLEPKREDETGRGGVCVGPRCDVVD